MSINAGDKQHLINPHLIHLINQINLLMFQFNSTVFLAPKVSALAASTLTAALTCR